MNIETVLEALRAFESYEAERRRLLLAARDDEGREALTHASNGLDASRIRLAATISELLEHRPRRDVVVRPFDIVMIAALVFCISFVVWLVLGGSR